MVKPKFVKAIAKDGEIIQEFPTEIVNPKICSDTTLTMIQGILRKVVSEGLAKPAGSKQFSVSGKQVPPRFLKEKQDTRQEE